MEIQVVRVSLAARYSAICIVIGAADELFGLVRQQNGLVCSARMICGIIITALCIGNFYQTYDYCCEHVSDTMA